MSETQTAPTLIYGIGDQPVPGYTLIRELGRGAMGVVWLAQTETGFERALKIINLQQRGGKKEYRGLRTIKQRKLLHGNMLTLVDFWLKDGEGRTIPDSDELDNTDSFFMPLEKFDPAQFAAAKTAPHSLAETEAPHQSVTAKNRNLFGALKAARRAAERTLTDAQATAPPSGLAGANPFADAPRAPMRRPVQLLVAMELGHKTLEDRIKQCQENGLAGIPADELLPYMEQAARGLDYLHREGIVHRDIKPPNIMLVGDVAKVCDYGLVVTADADLTKTSNAFTPLYASPEAVAEEPVTGKSDQYSLAITYVELRTGRSPYPSETAQAVYAAKETGKYDLSRIRSGSVRKVLKRALSPEPNSRYESCSEFIRELEKAEFRKWRGLWAVLLILVLLLALVAAALSVPSIRQRVFPAMGAANSN